MIKNYNWKRYWCLNEENYSTFKGYLIDPEVKYSVNSHLTSNPTNLKAHCIIMLGEPGSGKSFELNIMKNKLEDKLKTTQDIIHFIDLRGIGDSIQFENKVFNEDIIQHWKDSDYDLYVFLDSFDECYLRQDIIAELLLDKISEYPLDRLYLYITCRTGYWPVSLGFQLYNLFDNNYKLLNLVILRKLDIINALKIECETEDESFFKIFFEKVENLNAVAFAVRPMTLKALINQFKQNKDITANKYALFKSYCKYLCEELSPMRRDAGLSISYTPEQKYIVSARLATLALFSGKISFWTGIELETPEDSIPLSLLYQGRESISEQQFDVTKDCILETLACGLFYSSDSHRKWSHWNFIEFLASEYIFSKNISTEVILNLVKNPIDKGILPQFRGVVAWLCSFNDRLFNTIIQLDPITLIQSDIAFFTDERKEMIVKALIDNFEGSPLEVRYLTLTPYYKNLNHPRLFIQIEEALKNKEISFKTKRFVLKLAEKCNLSILSPSILGIILATTENIHTRVSASYTLKILINNLRNEGLELENIDILIPLALTDDLLDDKFDIKGNCLKILWPNYISFSQFINHFPEPSPGYVGSYFSFLIEDFILKLPESDIIKALDWFKDNLINFSEYSVKHKILEDLLLKSLDYFYYQNIMAKLGEMICVLITSGYYSRKTPSNTTFRDKLNNQQNIRKTLIRLVLSNLPFNESYLIQLTFQALSRKDSSFIIHKRPEYFELIHQEDLDFLIEEYKILEIDNYRKNLAYIIYRLISRNEIDLAYKLYKLRGEFIKYFKSWFGPIKLGGEDERRMREDYKREIDLEKQFQELKKSSVTKLIEPPPSERIIKCLEAFEKGNFNAWWQLNREMTLTKTSQTYGSDSNPDLTQMPGWRNSPPEIQKRIIEASQKYIVKGNPDLNEWLGKNIIYFAAYAGYRAIRLNYELDKEFIDSLSKEIWVKWTPILLLFRFYSNMTKSLENEEKIRKDLILKAYPYALDTFLFIISREIDHLSESGYYLDILDKIEYLYDENVAKILHSKVKDENIILKIKGPLLNILVSREFKPTIDYILNLLSIQIPEEIQEESIQVLASKALMMNNPNEYWGVVYKLIQYNKVFGRILIRSISDDVRFETSFFEKIKENFLADLYIWIFNEYPIKEDIPLTGMARFLTPRDFISTFRDNIINILEGRGTFEAVEAIQKIYNEITEIRQILSYRIIRAQELARATTWIPMSPQELYDLFQNPTSKEERGEVVHLLNILHLSDFQPGKTTESDIEYLIAQGYKIKDLYDLPISEFQTKILALEINEGVEINTVVITGDLSSTSVEKEYTITRNLLNFFNDKPVLIAPGNHDLNWDISDSDQKAKFNNFIDFLNKYLDSLEIQEIHHFPDFDLAYYYNEELNLIIIAINSSKKIDRDNPDLVILPSNYLNKIFKFFNGGFHENFTKLKKILICHHGWEKISNSQGIENFLLDMGISLILSGHKHKYYFRRIDELNNIANIHAGSLLTGIKYRMKRAGSTITEREGFNIYHIYKEGDSYKLKVEPWKREPKGWVIDNFNLKTIEF